MANYEFLPSDGILVVFSCENIPVQEISVNLVVITKFSSTRKFAVLQYP